MDGPPPEQVCNAAMGDIPNKGTMVGSEPEQVISPKIESLNFANSSTSLNPTTHEHIFGDQPRPSLRKRERVYHMSSDIFGIGSIVDRDGYHIHDVNNGSTSETFHTKVGSVEESPFESHMKLATQIGTAQGSDETESTGDPAFGSDRRTNARENGCNPVTGQGYAAESPVGKSQRRQYPQARSASLW